MWDDEGMSNPNRLSKGGVIVGSLDVDEGIHDTKFVDFDTQGADDISTGRLRWNPDDGTLEFGMGGGVVHQQIGLEQYVHVKHDTNAGLVMGKVVYQHGSDGANITALYAQANSDVTSADTIGVMAESVTGGVKGYCTTFGLIRGIDTSNLIEGATAWLSPTVAGAMTATKPSAPNHLVQVGFCLRSHAVNGMLFVSVQNGYELDELHDVRITSPQAGQVLKYNAGGYWENVAP